MVKRNSNNRRRGGKNDKKSAGLVILQITKDPEVVLVFNLAIFVFIGGLLSAGVLSWNYQLKLSLTFFVSSGVAWVVYFFVEGTGLVGLFKISKMGFDFFVKHRIRECTWRLTQHIPGVPSPIQKVGTFGFKIVKKRSISFVLLILATFFLLFAVIVA